MYALKMIDLKKTFVTHTVFENVNAGVAFGERVGLVGANGVGKSTLLQLLTGELQPDSGSVVWDKAMSAERVGLLTQTAEFTTGETVRDYVRRAKPRLLTIEQELRGIEARLQEADTSEIDGLMERYGVWQEQYEGLGGYTYDRDVERVLQEVGLVEAVWDHELASASGGQKTRAQLARLLLQEPQLLLLDEPTNHLDAETMDWLEGMLRQFAGTVLIVSHDRYFLDLVATRILELRQDGIGSYPGNYTAYLEQRGVERRTQHLAYQKQQVEIKHLQEQIGMYRKWFHLAHEYGNRDFANLHIKRSRSKERRLEVLEANKIDRPTDGPSIKLNFDTQDRLGNRIFQVEDVAVRFGERELYKNVRFAVERGECLALVGANGIGKSTLLKVLTGQLQPTEGTVKSSPQVRIGYFGQEVDALDPDKTILQEVLQVDGLNQTDARTLLACFLFRGEEVFKKIGLLSQGQKCRVAFVKLYFSGANVLVLDEPTNYLDIASRERVEEALSNFPGTVLLVSHDRYMIQRLATGLLLFKPGVVTHFPGTFDEWQHRQDQRGQSPQDLECKQRRMILQMQLSRLAEQHSDPYAKNEERLLIEGQMNRIQADLRAL